jgi:plastocyanin
MKGMRFVLVAALAVFALAAAGCGGEDEATDADTETITEATDTTETTPSSGSALRGTVGPGFDISMTTADGQELATISPGSYTLEVEDLASIHNFHLTGPDGGDVSTSVEEEGTQSFDVELEPGTYTFVCDPHASTMNGSFEVSG